MFVKQIDMKEAFRLAAAGREIKILVPRSGDGSWGSMLPDTLQNILADVMFFRQEPAMEVELIDEVPPQSQRRVILLEFLKRTLEQLADLQWTVAPNGLG